MSETIEPQRNVRNDTSISSIYQYLTSSPQAGVEERARRLHPNRQ